MVCFVAVACLSAVSSQLEMMMGLSWNEKQWLVKKMNGQFSAFLQ